MMLPGTLSSMEMLCHSPPARGRPRERRIGATYRFRQRRISRLDLPSAVRLDTYSLVRLSMPIRTMQIMCRARLASRTMQIMYRDANRALHMICMVRMGMDRRTREYVSRRTAEGKSKREILRCLKRYVAPIRRSRGLPRAGSEWQSISMDDSVPGSIIRTVFRYALTMGASLSGSSHSLWWLGA